MARCGREDGRAENQVRDVPDGPPFEILLAEVRSAHDKIQYRYSPKRRARTRYSGGENFVVVRDHDASQDVTDEEPFAVLLLPALALRRSRVAESEKAWDA